MDRVLRLKSEINFIPKTNTKMKARKLSVLTVLLTMCAATFAQGLKDAYKDYFLSLYRKY